jgi:hypothetical protein
MTRDEAIDIVRKTRDKDLGDTDHGWFGVIVDSLIDLGLLKVDDGKPEPEPADVPRRRF